MSLTEQEFIADLNTKIYQYVYRSLEQHFDPVIAFLQEISGNGTLNWHLQENKDKLKAVFSGLNDAIDSYALADGEFRTFILIKFTQIITETYKPELLRLYLSRGYNVTPESIVGSLASAYSVPQPQNTNFPDVTNTSGSIDPEPSGIRLVPKAIYQD